MKRKNFVITLGLCGILILGGCSAQNEDANTEFPAIEVEAPDVDREGINMLPTLSGEGVEKVETAFPDENQSYVTYVGVDAKMREDFKESLANLGFSDWMVMKDEGDVYETAITDSEQVTLVHSEVEDGRLQVYMIENIDELIEK